MQSKSKKKTLGTLRKCDRKEPFFYLKKKTRFDAQTQKNIDREIKLLPHQVALKEFPNKSVAIR
jgi:hypothetical protein